MDVEEKINNFLLSAEVRKIAKEVISILGLEIESFNLGIGLALLDLITENRIKESELKDFIKDFLEKNEIETSEDKISQIYDYLVKNFLPKTLELWKEEIEAIEIKEESFEEKEKRYLEIMKEVIKKPVEEKLEETKPVEKTIKEKIDEEEKRKILIEPKIEEQKTLTIGFEEKKEETLPEGAVIIKIKDDEEKKEEREILDLSNL